MGKGFSWSQFWEKDGAEDSLWRHLTGADTDAAYLILVTNAANGVYGKKIEVSLVRGIFDNKCEKYQSTQVLLCNFGGENSLA